MPKRELTERITEAMKYPERIRNVATSSHVHHGKCVAGNSRIALADGSFLRADKLYEKLKEKGKPVKFTEDEVVMDVSHCNISVLSLNKNTLRIETKPIQYIWKIRHNAKLIGVKLRNGLEIATTPEHKFLVFNGREITEKRAENIKPGDYVVCGKNLVGKEMSVKEVKLRMIEILSQDSGFYVFLKSKLKKKLKEKILKKGIKKILSEIDTSYKTSKAFYYCLYHGRYRLKDLFQLVKILGLDVLHVYDQIKFLRYNSSSKLVLPSSEEDFKSLMYLVGLLFGDGSRTSLTTQEEQIKKRFMLGCKRLGLKPTQNRFRNRAPRINSNGGLTFLRFLNLLFDYPENKKAGRIRINEFLQTLPKFLISEFIKGYFDADGSVEWGRSAISISSKSLDILKDLQLVLLKFGCTSQRFKNSLYISGTSAKLFNKNIGFTLTRKKLRLEKLAKKARFSRITETYPVDASLLKKLRVSLGMNLIEVFESYADYESGRINLTINSLPKVVSTFFLPNFGEFGILRRVQEGDVYFVRVNEVKTLDGSYVYDFTIPDNHNFVAEGMIVHNTALTDNLMAGAGMIAEEMAGKVMFTWHDWQERKRELTIYGANVSMVHEYEGKDYLINLVDTPGHVDFGGDVTRAMRAVDGTIVLVCAVEGIMPQTETVFRQALRERVKPVLFINKVDRLIKELKLSPEEMQRRFEEIIREVNLLIQKYAEEKYRDEWLVSVAEGSVAMGSAVKRWAISLPFMKKTGITFKEIIELTLQGREDELAKKAPLHQVVLDMLIKHLPSPVEAQRYRIEKIWNGDLNSEVGTQMLSCDPNGRLALIVTKMVPDPHVGFVATGRIFSGSIHKGKEVYLLGLRKKEKLQQVAVYKGMQRILVDKVTAGNIAAIVGIPDAFTGETVCEPDSLIEPFVQIRHLFEPVVTKSIEPENPMELPKLVATLRKLGKEDPTLQVKINEETGEYLVSGLGELHLEAKVELKLKELGLDVRMSKPLVVYREAIFSSSPVIEGKSPNKHNRFFICVEPLEPKVYRAMLEGTIPSELELKRKNVALAKKLAELGMSYEEAKNIIKIHNRNVLVDLTKGVQFLNEVIEMVKQGFEDLMEEGPLAKEPTSAVKVKLMDAELHEDPVHRGPGQIVPATRYCIREAMLRASPTLLEPKQIVRLDVPSELIGAATREIENRRGQILSLREERGATVITAKLPVAEMFGFDASLKSATSGRGFYSIVETVFEKLPEELREKVIKEIRRRKGLSEEIPKPES